MAAHWIVAFLLIVGAILVAPGCDCRSRHQADVKPSAPEDAAATGLKYSDEGHVIFDLDELAPDQRRIADKIIRNLSQYYPTWVPERQSIDDFYEHWYETPEIRRFMTTIDRRVATDRAWPVLFDEVQRTYGDRFMVLRGSPPGFYIPSFSVVVGRKKPRNITAVFRLSMLAPLYDYYGVLRDAEGRFVALELTPGDEETKAIAEQVRSLIARHFPKYRELPPEIGSVLVPNMKAESTHVGETILAELLFSDARTW